MLYDEKWLIEATVEDMQQAMSSGKLTSEKLVMLYMQRIARYDKQGKMINSVLEINPDALQIAAALDTERRLHGVRGTLHGIPILLKDNIDTHDKLHTSAGSLALANSVAPKDSFVASQLRKAGAVILGKANMTEWANFMTQGMKNGYSSRGGQVLNPYGPGEFDVGGSSSGSGAAVASNFTALAIGTETSGSILSPASSNSIVGIKPTVGLISRSGIIPISHSQDTAGPMARTVRDAAILLGALTGVDSKDPITVTSQDSNHQDYTRFLDEKGLEGARIGVPRSVYQRLDEERLAVMEQVIGELKDAGAVVIDPVELPCKDASWQHTVLVYEFKVALNAYLRSLSANVPVHSLKEVIDFNNAHAEDALKYGQTLLIKSEKTSGTLTELEYVQARIDDLRQSREEGIDYVIAKHKLEALLVPANFGAGIAARAGYPSITVPAGYTDGGRPCGATFTGLAYSEPILLKLAYAYEQATRHRVAPNVE